MLYQAYPVKSFGGRKSVLLSTTSWMGGRNTFLGVAYIVVGVISIFGGIAFTFMHFGQKDKYALLEIYTYYNQILTFENELFLT